MAPVDPEDEVAAAVGVVPEAAEPEELEVGLVGHKAPVTGTTAVPTAVPAGMAVAALVLTGAGVPDDALVGALVPTGEPVAALVLAAVVVPAPVPGIAAVGVVPLGAGVLAAQAERTKANTTSAENAILFLIEPPF